MPANFNLLLLTDCLATLEAGAEKQIFELTKRLNKSKYSLCVASLDAASERSRSSIESAGAQFKIFPVKRIYGFSGLRQGLEFQKYLKENKTDIVMTYHFGSDIWGVFWAHLAGVKTIISNRRDMGFWRKSHHILAYKIVNRWVSKIVVVANAVKKVVMEVEGVPEEKIEVIYNGVELDEKHNFNAELRGSNADNRGSQETWNLRPSACNSRPSALNETINSQHDYRSEFGISPTDIVILHLANLRLVKGHAYLLQAFAEIINDRPDVKLLLVGADQYDGVIQRQAQDLGLADKVILTGARKDARQILTIVDICVLPSLSEGMSNAILEYMAAGKPIVATNVGGNPELIKDGVNGILVEKESVQQLKNALIRLINDPNLRGKMGEEGLKKVQEFFTMDAMVKKYDDLFESVLRS